MIKILMMALLSFNVFSQDIVFVKKGDTVSFDGFLVAPKQMDKFRLINEERKLLEEKNIQLKDLGVVQDNRIKFFQQSADQYKDEIFRERTKSRIENILFFVGGVVLTGGISYGLQKTLK